MGRAATPSEIASVAAFLASDDAEPGDRSSTSRRRRVPRQVTVTQSPGRKMSASARSLVDGPTNYINGRWEDGQSSEVLHSVDPFTTDPIRDILGRLGRAGRAGDPGRAGRLRLGAMGQGYRARALGPAA